MGKGMNASLPTIHILPDWVPQSHVFVGWPSRPDSWRNGALPAQESIIRLAHAISSFAHVIILASPGRDVAAARTAVQKLGSPSIEVIQMSMDDCWIRDSGPVWVRHAETNNLIGVNFGFDAWGGSCYTECTNDIKLGRAIVEQCEDAQIMDWTSIVLEGGAISGDGEGTLLAVENCVLCNRRNPHITKTGIEKVFKHALGIKKVIWLPAGIIGDTDTGGHVDNLCVFIRPGVVILHWDKDRSSCQHKVSSRALQILQEATDAHGRRLTVVKVEAPPMATRSLREASGVVKTPGTKMREAGDLLPRSYINLLIVNKGVIVPSFDDKEADECAKITLKREAFGPGYQIVMIPANEFVLSGGGIHCLTLGHPQKNTI